MKYNKRPTMAKPAEYQMRVNPEVIDAIYEGILRMMIVDKKYRNHDYTARQLAQDLHTNTRYISATVSLRFGMNFSDLINSYRIREAQYLLTDRRYQHLTIEEIAHECGFRSRQTLHSAFFSALHQTPRQYQQNFNQNHKLQKPATRPTPE